MDINILGPGCKKCEKTLNLVSEVVGATGAGDRIEKVTDVMQIAGYGVVGTPAVVVDGEVKCVGKVPTREEIKTWLV